MIDCIELNGVTYRQLFAGLLRPLTNEEAIALRKTVAKNGILTAIHVVFDGDTHWVIDGWNRLLLAAEFNFAPEQIPEQPYPDNAPDDWLRELAVDLNWARRQLTPGDREALVVELRKQGKSQRTIAAELGVSVGTVNSDLQSAGVQNRTPETVKGADGKRYPARKPDYSSYADEVRQLDAAGDDVDTIAARCGIPTPAVADLLEKEYSRRSAAAADKAAQLRRIKDKLRAEEPLGLTERSPVWCPECHARVGFGTLLLDEPPEKKA